MEISSTFGASAFTIGDLQLFHNVDDPCVAKLLADCKVVRVGAGQQIDNGAGARLYVVLRGALELMQPDLHGGLSESASGGIVAGECVGELSVLDDEVPAPAIRVLQDAELLLIEADTLWRLIDESNGVARNLLRLLSFRIRAANAQLRRRQKVGEFYRQLSLVDSLTGLQNRAWLDQHLSSMVESARLADNPLSIIMVDIDHFKKFNDDYGHQAGDEVLKTAARVLTKGLRPSDFAARYGGEEMMVILPGASEDVAIRVAQRLCDGMRGTVFFSDMHRPLPHITASFGVASLQPEQDAGALVAAADAALYRAKRAGRNQVAH